MLGLLPETENVAAINAQLAQPLEPGRPPGAKPMTAQAKPAPPAAAPPRAAVPAASQPPARPVPTAPRDLRREASYVTPGLLASGAPVAGR
jgi:hypothetical protein